jgi:hypothetical protein
MLLGIILASLATKIDLRSQELPIDTPSTQQRFAVPANFREQATTNAAATCLEPPPLPGLEDYDGPMAKTVGIFAHALERKSVHEPHYKPGVALCSLDVQDKLFLFIQDATDPMTFLSAGFDSAIDHVSHTDPTFGQGIRGYSKRFGANMADRLSSKFFKDFAYPTLFSEDPRYYRLGRGGTGERLLHATGHLVVAHRGDGQRMFNFSEWLGTASAVALNNLYHPGEQRGAGEMSRNMGYRFASYVGFDVLREFWPDIAHTLRLPFRGAEQKSTLSTNGSR